jgi:hypothetical protein
VRVESALLLPPYGRDGTCLSASYAIFVALASGLLQRLLLPCLKHVVSRIHSAYSLRPAAHFYEHAIRFDDMFTQLILPLKEKRTHDVVADFAEETASEYVLGFDMYW